MTHSILPAARVDRDPLARAELFEEIGRGAHSVVVRGRLDGTEVAVKRARRGAADLERVGRRFVREAQMLARARHVGLVQVYEVGEDAFGCPYMVMELIRGQTLAEQLAKRGAMEPSAVVVMAQGILSALGEVHRRGLVHRDLKPANLMLRDDGRPVIIDFGLAAAEQSELGRERNEAVGTFLYSPPEQTGMLHRIVDARSDLYSLGVILYECLAGHPPFATTEVPELLRMHAVEPPPPLAPLCPAAPPVLCAVIHKLLAKDPDSRYATAASVRADLMRLAELSKQEDPTLGAHDADADLVALPLVQRESALQTLIAAISGARFGQGRVVLLHGARGVGKSRLLNEALRHGYADEALVLKGACTSGTPAPFGVLRQALSRWLGHGKRTEREAQIREAAAGGVAYLGRAFPELQAILGAASDSAEGDPPEVYSEAVTRFLLTLGEKAEALVLALDDLQWLDPASANVLARLFPLLPSSHLTLVCALSEMTPQLEKLCESQQIEVTELARLEDPAVRSLIAGFLAVPEPDSELVRQLGMRSQGNPRLLVEYLREALDADLLVPAWGGWSVDRARLSALRLPDSFDGLTLRRLDALSNTVRLLLRKAAFIGSTFEVDILARFSNLPVDTVRRVLAQVVAQGIVSEEDGGSHRFHHDVVVRTLVSELSEDGLATAHRQAADLLDQNTSRTDYAFLAQRAHHHVAGVNAERAEAARMAAVTVASAALQGQAAGEARSWFRIALELTERYGLEHRAETYQGLGEAWMAEGNIPEGIVAFDRAIELCRDDIDRAWLRARVAMAYLASSQDTKQTGRYVEQALVDLDEPLPRSTLSAILKAIWFALAFMVREHSGSGYEGAAVARKARVHWKVLEIATGWALFTEQLPLMFYIGFLAPFVGQRLGPSRELACSYGGFGTVLGLMGLPRAWSQYFIQRGYAIADQFADPVAHARVRTAHASMLAFQGRVAQAEEVLEDLVRNHSGWLEMPMLIMAHIEYSMLFSLRGYTQRGLSVLESCMRRMGARPDEPGQRLESMTPMLCPLYALEGRHGEMGDRILHVTDGLSEPGENRLKFAAAWGTEMSFRLQTNEIGPELALACDQLERAKFDPRRVPWQVACLFMNLGYARYALYSQAAPEQKAGYLAKFAASVRSVQQSCRHPLLLPHVPILEAKLLHAQDDLKGALAALARADALAHASNSPHALYESHSERARILRKTNEEAATFEAEQALFLAERQVWPYRAQRLRDEFGVGRSSTIHTVAQRGPVGVTTSSNQTSSAAQSGERRGRDAVVAVSLAIADEVEAAAQAHAAVTRLVQLLGAERGCLFLADEDGKGLTRIAACNARGEHLPAEVPVAQTLVERVYASGTPLVVTSADQGVALGGESVSAQGLRSIICAPLRMRERVLGAIYLDSRLAAGVFTTADLDVLVAVANQIAISDYARRSALRDVAHAQQERELQTSAVVQSLLLPSCTEANTPDFELAALFRPMGYAGGDFWHYDVSADGMLRLWIGDVTGHGVGAAMVGAAVSGCYRTLRDARYTLTTEELLAEINRTVNEICRGAYRLPIGVLELSPGKQSARYLSAAAPPLLVWDPESGLSMWQCGGTPLGSDTHVVKTLEFPIRPQQRFLAISDGVLEMVRADGKQLGIRRLSALFSECASQAAAPIRDHLGRELDAIRGAAKVTDDLTLVTVSTRT